MVRPKRSWSSPLPSVAWDLAPRRVRVDPRFTRESEHAFADDVHLDLRGAAGDGRGLGAAQRECGVVAPGLALVDLLVGVGRDQEGARRTHEVDDELGHVDEDPPLEELEDRTLGTGHALLALRLRAQAPEA